MADADNALRSEIEKVRERARLQALAQGLPPDRAVIQGDAAVLDFCSRWGIRPEMLGPDLARAARAPAKEEQRKVDLGTSPLRNTTAPSQTQAIRISDLLKKAKDQEGSLPPPPAPAPAAAPGPASAAGVMPGSRPPGSLSTLLQRMKTQPSAPPAPAPRPPQGKPAGAPAASPAAPPSPSRPANTTGFRGVTSGDPLGGTGSLTANAERRRQVLEEFDRTYAEVQSLLEQRIGVVDVALADASKGISGAIQKAAARGIDSQDLEVLAVDVDRLRNHLQSMMQLCEEFLGHLQSFSARSETAPGAGPAAGGPKAGGKA
jgi:hypothetical protein